MLHATQSQRSAPMEAVCVTEASSRMRITPVLDVTLAPSLLQMAASSAQGEPSLNNRVHGSVHPAMLV